MKKWLGVLGLVVVFSIPALADVDCKSVMVCTLARDDGLCHPAVLFNVIAPQSVAGTFSLCEEMACGGLCSDPVDFAFDLGKGLQGVLLTFIDEPPICTMVSSQWTIDVCDAACGDHHCVTPTCPVGAEAFMKEIKVKR